MIISKTVNIRISTSNKDHFEKLGYKVKLNEYIEVNVCHLKPNSKVIIDVECDVCHRKTQIRYDVYMRKSIFSCSYKCAAKLYFAKSQETFIAQLNEVYKNNLDFSKSVYVNNHTCVIVECEKHGEFKMLPKDLIDGRGCIKCNKEKRIEKRYKKFVSEAKILHNNKYTYPNYSDSNYIDSSTKLVISCPIHGDFKQTSSHHLLLCGCQKCSNTSKRLKRLKRLSDDKFDGNQVFPSYNKKGCDIFDEISKNENIHIQHAMNEGEYHIEELGYWIDGYDAINNVVYEYDEKHHFIKGELRQKDLDRQKEIENFLNCKFIRIKD